MWEKQRAQLLATIKSKKGKVQGIMTKAADDGRTADDGEEDEIAVLEA